MDSALHHEVPSNDHHIRLDLSVGRMAHTAWTPPSLPDSIVLLGGAIDSTASNAEVVPGHMDSDLTRHAAR